MLDELTDIQVPKLIVGRPTNVPQLSVSGHLDTPNVAIVCCRHRGLLLRAVRLISLRLDPDQCVGGPNHCIEARVAATMPWEAKLCLQLHIRRGPREAFQSRKARQGYFVIDEKAENICGERS